MHKVQPVQMKEVVRRVGKRKDKRIKAGFPRFFTLEMFMFTLVILSGITLFGFLVQPELYLAPIVVAGALFTFSITVVIRLLMDPDSVRARQSDAMLKLASQTLACMDEGMNVKAAQKICSLLLPSTAANAIAITDRDCILGYAGVEEEMHEIGSVIRTQATTSTLKDGELRVLLSPDEIGFSHVSAAIRAAIVAPLTVGGEVAGTLKFYFRKASNISDTQVSIAEGFGQLLSTQMAATSLEDQKKLATRMELKALQSQINPHFLFNTINTIAALVRTDPNRARMLLREFAVFYRRTLENSSDRIIFSREIEQTMRYFSFEVARFGEDRLTMEIEIEPYVDDMMVPPFIVQPLVENAVRHAMPSTGMLKIQLTGKVVGRDVHIAVKDNGVGMSADTRDSIFEAKSTSGLGIAIGNVRDRIKGHFGSDSCIEVESEPGQGTTIRLCLSQAVRAPK